MELSEKLIGMGEENKHLYNTLRLLQTEQVDLEAKLSLANDTKRAIDHERGSHGEIAAMKSEIHRMEVRSLLSKKCKKIKTNEFCFAQFMSVREKIHDIEHLCLGALGATEENAREAKN